MAYFTFNVYPIAAASQKHDIYLALPNPVTGDLVAEAVGHPMDDTPVGYWDGFLLENQAGPIGLANWDGSVTTPAPPCSKVPFTFGALDERCSPTVIVPLGLGGNNQGGQTAGAPNHPVSIQVRLSPHGQIYPFRQQDAQLHQPSPGRTRAEPTRVGCFQPYQTHPARASGYVNAQAGPSTVAPPRIPLVGRPTKRPLRKKPEISANAEQQNQTTEENKVPVSGFYRSRIPRAVD